MREGVNGQALWEKIEFGHETQEGLLLLLANTTARAVEAKHEHGKARALICAENMIELGMAAGLAGTNADLNQQVMGLKLQSDLAAGELMVVKERLKTLDGQLKRLQSGFVSWRAP